MKIIATVWFIAALVCAAGWWISNSGLRGLCLYMTQKGYPQPPEDELRKCIVRAMRRGFKN